MNDNLIFVSFFSGIWIFIGIGFYIVGKVLLKPNSRKEKRCTKKTYARVKDYVKREEKIEGDETDCFWYPIFEYNDDGIEVEKVSKIGSTQQQYKIGQKVKLHYNPNDYDDYFIEEEQFIGKLICAGGIISIMIGIISAIIILKRW